MFRQSLISPAFAPVEIYGRSTADEAAELWGPAADAPHSFYVRAGCKRAFDILLALAVLIFLAPLLIALAVGLIIQDGAPLLFRHKRIGHDGRTFKCLKFRSMRRDAEAALSKVLRNDPAAKQEWEATHKLRKDPRIHALGRVLRKSSLDEIPQLFNVLRGEMSIVGPRPIVEAEVSRYRSDIVHYLAVKPGITGLWQVSGRSNTGYDERVALDVFYVQKLTFAGDLKILIRTFWVVLVGNGSC